jgi:hypothetical protein
MDPNITTASMKAVLSALERLGVDIAPGQLAASSASGASRARSGSKD